MSRRASALALTIGGLIGATGGTLFGIGFQVVEPSVPKTELSWPFGPTLFRITEPIWTLSHVLVLIGVLALVRSVAAGSPRWGKALALVGFGLMIPSEFGYVFFPHADQDSTPSAILGTAMGLSSLVAAIGLIRVGIWMRRHTSWSSWRRLAPLTAGLFVPVVLLPAFAIIGWNIWVIAGWHVFLTLLGVAMYQEAQSMEMPRRQAPRFGTVESRLG